MVKFMIRATVVLCASCLARSAGSAELRHDKIDPSVLRDLASGLPRHFPLARTRQVLPRRAASTLVVVEVETEAKALTPALSRAGLRIEAVGGRPALYGRFVFGRANRDALTRLALLPQVRRIAQAPSRGPLPMEHSAELLGLAAARGSRSALGQLTGAGVRIADLDSNVDVFHPQFFRADAGYYEWLDVDGDGALTPGVDAVDLDGDGAAQLSETLEVVRAETTYLAYGTVAPARSMGFDPSIDWLYVDLDANGQRDHGAQAGFSDDTPAFGEPLFVPDDANQDGDIEAAERLVRLGTSKFEKVYVHLSGYFPTTIDHVYERGVDLSALRGDLAGPVYGYSETLHATGVLSIAAGDVALPCRRFVGLAPDADLVLAFELSADGDKALPWVLGEAPDVVLHESAEWAGTVLDGSDVYSVMVDESSVEQGVIHTCAVGNTGGSRKHLHLPLLPGEAATTSFEVPDDIEGIYFTRLSLNVTVSALTTAVLTLPTEEEVDLLAGPPAGLLSNDVSYYVVSSTSPKGTQYVDLALFLMDPTAALVPGDYALTFGSDGAAVVDAYLEDNVSSWGLGSAFAQGEATDDRTIGIPAVSQTCIAVGAHPGHVTTSSEPWFHGEEAQGEVRAYSGRGPTIDGRLKPDVLAPDNPWAATSEGPSLMDDVAHGALAPMSGTSGAGPHVTGVTALLVQAGVKGAAATTAIRDSAIADAATGEVPNQDYGYGRLSAAGALGVATGGTPLAVSLEASPATLLPGQAVSLAVSYEPSSPAAECAWDDGYDGTWDVTFGALVTRDVVLEAFGPHGFKVRCRTAQGLISDAVARVVVLGGEDSDSETEDTDTLGGTDSETASGDSDSATDSGGQGGSGSNDDGCGCHVAGHSRHGSSLLRLAWAAAVGGAGL